MTGKQLLFAAAVSVFLPACLVSAMAQPQRPAAERTPGQPAPATAKPAAPQGGDRQPSQPESENVRRLPVLAVTSVEVMRSAHGSRLDIVRAVGYVSSSGWSSPSLVPLSRGTPSDGMLDLVLEAGAPSDDTAADGIERVEAILPVEQGHPFKGVRLRSATNVVVLKTVPGYAEVPPLADPCVNCVGKLLVAKGATAPAGVPAGDVVREQDLPPTTRIIKPTDGVVELPFDPNRLTLVIGDDGKITDAAWD